MKSSLDNMWLADSNDCLVFTDRVKRWKENPHGRLPVSCTAFMVEDTMEGESGIEESWQFASRALRYGAGVAFHLDKIRPKGTQNDKGLVASGAVSFAQIYSVINDILRRGGIYKKGAITLHMRYDHGDIVDFLNMDTTKSQWVKRSVTLPGHGFDFKNWEHTELLINKITTGEVWLTKEQFDKNGQRLLSNVCLEILLKHRGTCLLQHVNLAKCGHDRYELSKAFIDGMIQLCEMHRNNGILIENQHNHYLTPKEDKQVGLGVVGLASFLAQEKITYKEMAEVFRNPPQRGVSKAGDFYHNLRGAYYLAAIFAKYRYGMERAFTIAPTASCAYQHYDKCGYVLTPEISPPLGVTVDRHSDIFGTVSYDHHPDCETAANVDYWDYFDIANGWQKIMNETGLAHSISFNSWDTVPVNIEFLERWYNSKLLSLYYRMPVFTQAALDKTFIQCDVNKNQHCSSCSE